MRHGRGKKNATLLDLHKHARGRIDQALGEGGHLYELEQAWQRGEIEDYHLWPGCRMSESGVHLKTYLRGSRKHPGDPGPMSHGGLSELFHRYERAIGIESVKGRAFYGLRRTMSDLAEDVETDTRALREITGWKNDETRRRYQKKKVSVQWGNAA